MVNEKELPTDYREGFATAYLKFIRNTGIPMPLPDNTKLLYPYENREVCRVMEQFYNKYYGDKEKRIYLIGINPGRFGGGITGIPFTDPHALKEFCAIDHRLEGSRELSSRFIYDLIEEYGGARTFYRRFFLTALSPLGFTKDGKNRNYYDAPALFSHLKPWLIKSFKTQLNLGAGADRTRAFSLGQGKNYKILLELNREHHFFDQILPLPHPRWIMQYRRKEEKKFIQQYIDALETARLAKE